MVVEPLDSSVPDALEWPEILVTELEAILRLPAEDVEGTVDETFQLYNMSARTRLLRERALYHELTYYYRKRENRAAKLTYAGDAASSPRNSPICHCRVSIHNASRTSAFSARSKSCVRGRPSNRFHSVIVGSIRLPDSTARSPHRG